MRKAPIIGSYLCQLMILALLGYGLDLGCLLQSDGCIEERACCSSCNLPANLDKSSDQSVHIKLGPALLPTETLTLTAVIIALGEVEPFFEAETPPSMLLAQQTDPVRGPPLA